LKSALITCACALSLLACKKDKAAPPSGEPLEGAAAAEDPAAAGPYTLSPDKLDRYVKYEAKMIEVMAGTMKDVAAFEARADAGKYAGALGAAGGMSDAVAVTRKRAEAEEAARKQVGLSSDELDRIDQVVHDIIAKRLVSKDVVDDSMIASMESMRDRMPKDQQASLDRPISEMKKLRDDVKNLTEERQKFGDANVDLVLSREADLMKNWEAQMNALGGKKP
jgi:hypothetical protein